MGFYIFSNYGGELYVAITFCNSSLFAPISFPSELTKSFIFMDEDKTRSCSVGTLVCDVSIGIVELLDTSR